MYTACFSMKTPAGPLYLTASKKGLRSVDWRSRRTPLLRSLKSSSPEIKVLRRAVRELREYFQGGRKKFALPLDEGGTVFQKRVWGELRKIPYGKTCSYKDIARRIRSPRAARAVGTANGQNPLCIVVPCHRVIAADGTLGGYSAGLSIKKRLLKIEEN